MIMNTYHSAIRRWRRIASLIAVAVVVFGCESPHHLLKWKTRRHIVPIPGHYAAHPSKPPPLLIDPTFYGFAPTWWAPWPEMHEMALIEEIDPVEQPKQPEAENNQIDGKPADATDAPEGPAEDGALPIPPAADVIPTKTPPVAPLPLPVSTDEPLFQTSGRGPTPPVAPLPQPISTDEPLFQTSEHDALISPEPTDIARLGAWPTPLVRFKLSGGLPEMNHDALPRAASGNESLLQSPAHGARLGADPPAASRLGSWSTPLVRFKLYDDASEKSEESPSAIAPSDAGTSAKR